MSEECCACDTESNFCYKVEHFVHICPAVKGKDVNQEGEEKGVRWSGIWEFCQCFSRLHEIVNSVKTNGFYEMKAVVYARINEDSLIMNFNTGSSHIIVGVEDCEKISSHHTKPLALYGDVQLRSLGRQQLKFKPLGRLRGSSW